MTMRLRPLLLFGVLLALAVNGPGLANAALAKEAHGQHGSRAGAASASGKAANRAETKASGATSVEPAIPPPVLPSQRARRGGTINPNVKAVPMGNAAHRQATGTATPAVRNAIGQAIVAPKNFVGSEAHVSSGLQGVGQVPRTVQPPSLHGAPPAVSPVVSSSPTRANTPALNVANANRNSGNGAALNRPVATPAIGGAARPNYGINGTTVQTRH
jgi:hypothetical protein